MSNFHYRSLLLVVSVGLLIYGLVTGSFSASYAATASGTLSDAGVRLGWPLFAGGVGLVLYYFTAPEYTEDAG